ncbi:MAG: Holliday junction resolvase RuvX [Bacteroidota bacterium]|nr:Holliday junction resolvase RuvX [Bacteroidota bacterium]
MTDYKRYMGIDYGKKRTGIAVTDPLITFAYSLTTLDTGNNLIGELKKIIIEKEVSKIVLGYPDNYDDEESSIGKKIKEMKTIFEKEFGLEVILWDENFSSVRAMSNIMESVTRKSKRREKGLVDRNSAAIILQEYIDSIK